MPASPSSRPRVRKPPCRPNHPRACDLVCAVDELGSRSPKGHMSGHRHHGNEFLRHFDADLQSFYHDVICGELDLSCERNVTAVKRALRQVVHAYKKGTVEAKASRILYDTPEKRCAYVLKHCACFGSAVARHFLRLLRSDSHVLEAALRRRRVDVCCLGGGPGTEVVALAKTIGRTDASRTYRTGHRRREPLELNVHVLDISGDWRKTTGSVLDALNETDAFFDREALRVSFDGLTETDLTDTDRWWEGSVRGILGRADVITLIYFVSAVHGSSASTKCASMLKSILSAVKPGCLLFFLDSAKDLHYEAVRSSAASFQDGRYSTPVLYGPFLQQFHVLSRASVRKFAELYLGRFDAMLCLTDCFLSCAGWTKTHLADPRTVTRCALQEKCIVTPCRCCRGGNHASVRNWRKRVEFNNRRQRLFQEWFQSWILAELRLDFATEDGPLEPEDDDDGARLRETLYATKSKHRRMLLVS